MENNQSVTISGAELVAMREIIKATLWAILQLAPGCDCDNDECDIPAELQVRGDDGVVRSINQGLCRVLLTLGCADLPDVEVARLVQSLDVGEILAEISTIGQTPAEA